MRALPLEYMTRIRRHLAFLYGEERAGRLLERFALIAGRYETVGELPRQAPARLWSAGTNVLITYPDMVREPARPPLATLHGFLRTHLKGTVDTVHILPFFPSSSDEGFSVTDYRQVDPEYGTWDDIRALGADFRLMFDLVLNHASAQGEWFRQYSNGIAPYRDYFIEVDPDAWDLGKVVRPRSSPLLTTAHTAAGDRLVWTTFSPDQVDLNFANPDVLFEFIDILLFYICQGARIIRLDAIAYLWKESGTSCIHLPQTHEVVRLLRTVVDMLAPGVLLLTETNVPHAENVRYFGEGDEAHMVYQFSLPPLLLHALLKGDATFLQQWARGLEPPPPGCTYLNFTASHDGIGVRPLEGIVPEEEIRGLVEAVRARGGEVSEYATPGGGSRPYELNITYYDALGEPGQEDGELHLARFLCAQTVMLSLQGIPALYFHSLTATRNDTAAVATTGSKRAINRRRWLLHELETALHDERGPAARVFGELTRRLRLRSGCPAFHPAAGQRVLDLPPAFFGIERTTEDGTRLLAVAHLGPGPSRLDLSAPAGDGEWTDLIGGGTFGGQALQGLEMAPYQCLWLAAEGLQCGGDGDHG